MTTTPPPTTPDMPFAYAYRYQNQLGDGTVIRFESGPWNGQEPIEAIPLYTRTTQPSDESSLLFIKRLATEYGAIVSSASCSESEIFHAQKTNRFFVDEDGLGYVLRNSHWLKIADKANAESVVDTPEALTGLKPSDESRARAALTADSATCEEGSQVVDLGPRRALSYSMDAGLDVAIEALEQASLRSNYPWSKIADYDPQDWKNEGAMELAKKVLGLIKSASATGKVRDGWKLVPIEPTPEMIMAGLHADHPYYECSPPREVYKEMLCAAPQPPAQEEKS
jgi:hypothetical protein